MKITATLIIFFSVGFVYGQGAKSFPDSSPRAVLERYCEMDFAGKALTAEGSKEMEGILLRQTVSTSKKKIIVVKDFVVSEPVLDSHDRAKAEFYVEYLYLGQIDSSSARYSRLPKPLPPSNVKVRVEYYLVLDTHTSPPEWRIEHSEAGSVTHVSVPAAISYATRLRTETQDPIVQKNADQSISILKKLR